MILTRQIRELDESAFELQFDHTRWAMALLADDHFGLAVGAVLLFLPAGKFGRALGGIRRSR